MWITKIKESIYNYLKKKLYRRESNLYFDKVVEDGYDFYYALENKPKYSIFSPVVVVIREIELTMDPYYFRKLGIMGIEVDTQNEALITVLIKLKRPGFIIGKGGKIINSLQDRLKYLFNRPVVIKIDEVRKDINEPIIL